MVWYTGAGQLEVMSQLPGSLSERRHPALKWMAVLFVSIC